MLSLQEQRILGELTDTTFGRSSIRDAGHAIAYKSYSTGSYSTGKDRNDMEGMILEIRFETIVNINPVEGVQNEQQKIDDQSIKAINEETSITQIFK